MSNKNCPETGKRPQQGRTYCRRGIAKKKKGIGLNITGKSKRRFIPNIQVATVYCEKSKRYVKKRLSTTALRTARKNIRNS
tara:strand:- start:195 stop:437 length:243 start_codon:yes stop_codon:yes gene_type:complete